MVSRFLEKIHFNIISYFVMSCCFLVEGVDCGLRHKRCTLNANLINNDQTKRERS